MATTNDVTTSVFADAKKQLTDIHSPHNPSYTRDRIYGIEYTLSDSTLTCTRIGDAVGKTAPQDFDSIYPWSDIKVCNLSIANGKMTVTYDGHPAFARDGSGGNVMVEIPAFYVCRERVADQERWLISGVCQDGFELHPWFKNADGSTVEHRYYGAYPATIDLASKGVFSHTGTKPFQYGTDENKINAPTAFETLLKDTGYSRNTLHAWSAIQYLFCIEYATFNSQSIFNGVTYCPYFSGSTAYVKIQNVGQTTNTLLLPNHTTRFGANSALFGAGMYVCIGTAAFQVANRRKITHIALDGDHVRITVDGDAITTEEGMYCYAVPQNNGLTDDIPYHTGAATGMHRRVAPFKYRFMENIWGNIWEAVDGLRILDGVYYISDPAHYHDAVCDHWTALSYAAPMVSATDAVFTNRITRMGFDHDLKTVLMPETLYEDAPTDMTFEDMKDLYFGGDAFYSNTYGDTVYMPFIGGGWDHHENAGLFCVRFTNAFAEKVWLYGERITY